jgi:hypothetical protein
MAGFFCVGVLALIFVFSGIQLSCGFGADPRRYTAGRGEVQQTNNFDDLSPSCITITQPGKDSRNFFKDYSTCYVNTPNADGTTKETKFTCSLTLGTNAIGDSLTFLCGGCETNGTDFLVTVQTNREIYTDEGKYTDYFEPEKSMSFIAEPVVWPVNNTYVADCLQLP